MNVKAILTNIVLIVTPKMHKTRQQAIVACVKSLANGNRATVTSIGRGILCTKASEKNCIKRADRLLSNGHLNSGKLMIYQSICRLFCSCKRPVISIDWSDLDAYKGKFLLRAAMSVQGRPITLYQEVHDVKTKEKQKTHKDFLRKLSTILPAHCEPIIVTDAGYKSPWFRLVEALGWEYVGRVRKPHHYSVNKGKTWQCIRHLYATATCRPKRCSAMIARSKPFTCTLTLFKQKPKGRHALNSDGKKKQSKASKTHEKGANDPWLLASNIREHKNHSKQVVAIYRQRMQIEEGFRDMKSVQFGLGLEKSKSTKISRVSILILLTTLASLALILLGMAVKKAKKHLNFQANTVTTRAVLSFHTLGLRAIARNIQITRSQWRRTIKEFEEIITAACAELRWG